MSRICGFALFFIGIGMLIGLILPQCLVSVLMAAICLLVGYNLFCCSC